MGGGEPRPWPWAGCPPNHRAPISCPLASGNSKVLLCAHSGGWSLKLAFRGPQVPGLSPVPLKVLTIVPLQPRGPPAQAIVLQLFWTFPLPLVTLEFSLASDLTEVLLEPRETSASLHSLCRSGVHHISCCVRSQFVRAFGICSG